MAEASGDTRYSDICENMEVGGFKIENIIPDGNTFNSLLFSAYSSEGVKYVLKCIKKDSAGNCNSRECDFIQYFNHPNLMNCIGVPFETERYQCYFMKYADGGDLFNLIFSSKKLPETHIKDYAFQMVEAMYNLHSMRIFHGDIKLENFLLFSDNDNKTTGHRVVLTDFGFSEYVILNKTDHITKGTQLYLAPEIIKNQQYGYAVDVWAFGVCLYMMFAKDMPFDNSENIEKYYDNLQKGLINMDNLAGVPKEAVDLICRCLVVDPNERITMNDIKSHEWFAKFISIPKPESNMFPIEFAGADSSDGFNAFDADVDDDDGCGDEFSFYSMGVNMSDFATTDIDDEDEIYQ